MKGQCSEQYVIESSGEVFPCDFYCLENYSLGNINTSSIEELDEKRKELGFIEESLTIPIECKKCSFYTLCRNGCKRNRNKEGKFRFCESYKQLLRDKWYIFADLVSRL